MTKCHYCDVGNAAPGFVTSSSVLGSLTMVVKGVPADVCGDCGEGRYSWDVVKRLGEMTDAAREAGAEVVIRWYDADKPVRRGAGAAIFDARNFVGDKSMRWGARPLSGIPGYGSQALTLSAYPMSDDRRCFLCKNDALNPGVTDTSLTRGDVVMVVKDVPAQVCTNCKEPYLERAVYEQLKAEFKAAEMAGVEFVARRYAAVGRAAVEVGEGQVAAKESAAQVGKAD